MHYLFNLRPGPTVGLVFVALFTAWLCLAPQTEIYARNDVGKTEIRGRVTDEAGIPLVGVTIVERGIPNMVAHAFQTVRFLPKVTSPMAGLFHRKP